MSKTILVVDDEPQIVRFVRAYLEDAGYRVVTAGDGQQALFVARHDGPFRFADAEIIDGRFIAPHALESSGVEPITPDSRVALELLQARGGVSARG